MVDLRLISVKSRPEDQIENCLVSIARKRPQKNELSVFSIDARLPKLNVSALSKSRPRPQGSAPATEVLRQHHHGAHSSHTKL